MADIAVARKAVGLQRAFLPSDIEDLAGHVRVLAGLRLIPLTLMIVGGVVSRDHAWLTAHPLIGPVVILQAGLSLVLLFAWDRLGWRIVRVPMWSLAEAAGLVALLVMYGATSLTMTVVFATLVLLVCGWRGAMVAGVTALVIIGVAAVGAVPLTAPAIAAVFGLPRDSLTPPGTAELVILHVSLAIMALAGVATGMYMRGLLRLTGRARRQSVVERVRTATADERIRVAADLHDGLTKTLSGSAMMALALGRRLSPAASARSRALAQELADTLSQASRESRGLLQALRGATTADLASICHLAMDRFAQIAPEATVSLELPDVPITLDRSTQNDLAYFLARSFDVARAHGATLIHVQGQSSPTGVTVRVPEAGRLAVFCAPEIGEPA